MADLTPLEMVILDSYLLIPTLRAQWLVYPTEMAIFDSY